MNIQATSKPAVCVGGIALTCVLAGLPTDLYAAKTETQFQDWFYKTVVDEMDDSTQHIASSHAIGGGKGGLMVIKCDDEGGRPYAIYFTGMFMGLRSETTKTIYRIDKYAPVEEQWRMDSKDVLNANFDQVAVMAQGMMAGSQLVIQSYDYDFNRAQHVFSLKGASAAIGRVVENCAHADRQPVQVRPSAMQTYQQPTYTPQQPAQTKPRRPISGNSKGMSLEDILGQ